MSEKLKPCPWCNDDQKLFDCVYGGDEEVSAPYSIACGVCHSSGPGSETEDGARISWNRRHQESTQSTQSSEFERMMK